MKILAIKLECFKTTRKSFIKIKDKTIIDLILTRISNWNDYKNNNNTSNSANNKKLTKQIKDLKFDYYEK